MDFFKNRVNKFKSFLSSLVLNKRFWLLSEILLILIFISYVCFRQYKMLYGLDYPDFDLSIYHQGVWLLSRFQDPFVTVRGLHLFADHATIIHFFLVPIYWIIPSPLVLLFAQTLALGLGGFLVYLISLKEFKSYPFAVFLSFIYFMYPALHYLAFFNYHPVSFAVSLVLLLWYAYQADNKLLALISGILLVLVQEEIILVLIGISFYLWIIKRWKFAKWLFFLGILSALFIGFVFMPHFSESSDYQYASRTLGTLGDVAKGKSSVFNLLEKNVLTDKNSEYTNNLFSPLSYLNILNPFPIMFNPMFWINLVSDWPYQHEIRYHYTSGVIGTIFISLICGLSFLYSLVKEDKRKMFFVLVSVILLTGTAMNNYKDHWTFSVGGMFSDNPHIDKNLTKEISALNRMTEGHSVSITYNMLPFFSDREEAYMWPNPFKNSYYGLPGKEYNLSFRPDYVILLRSNLDNESRPMMKNESDYIMINETTYVLVFERKNMMPMFSDDPINYRLVHDLMPVTLT